MAEPLFTKEPLSTKEPLFSQERASSSRVKREVTIKSALSVRSLLLRRIVVALVMGAAVFYCLRVLHRSAPDSAQASWQSLAGSAGPGDCLAPNPAFRDGTSLQPPEPSWAPAFRFLAIPVGLRAHDLLADPCKNTGISSPARTVRSLGLESRAPPTLHLA